jgi:transcriptional regulator with XRE-family HTH domain
MRPLYPYCSFPVAESWSVDACGVNEIIARSYYKSFVHFLKIYGRGESQERGMMISDLQKRLRLLIGRRIAAGEMSGAELARRAGFQQAHVSNFLNGRRGLSIEAMDEVMRVMHLRVRDLMPETREYRRSAGGRERDCEWVPVVNQRNLLQPKPGVDEALEFLCFKKSFLRRFRPAIAGDRTGWQRFVLLKADRETGVAMRPRLVSGAMLLLDRHYNSLRSYRRHERNLYVVKHRAECAVRYVELQGRQLTLRPENQEWALGCILLGKSGNFSNYIVGRVAHIAMET